MGWNQAVFPEGACPSAEGPGEDWRRAGPLVAERLSVELLAGDLHLVVGLGAERL